MSQFENGDNVLIFNPNHEYHLKQGIVDTIFDPKHKRNIRILFPDGKYRLFNKVELDTVVFLKKGSKVMNKTYFLQRTDDLINWEEVDEYTWNNYLNALGPDEKARFTFFGGRKPLR